MKLGNLKTWRVLPADNGIVLPGPERRLLIELVGSGNISMLHGNDVLPLGELRGYLSLEALVEGDVEIYSDSPQGLLFRTQDQEQLGIADGLYSEPYVVMWERGPQENPEFRRMMMIAQLRDNERARQMDEAAALIRQLQAERENGNRLPATGTSATASAGTAGADTGQQAAGGVSAGTADTLAGTSATAPKSEGSAAGDAGQDLSGQPKA